LSYRDIKLELYGNRDTEERCDSKSKKEMMAEKHGMAEYIEKKTNDLTIV
jgi:hypothetical protein